MKAEGMVFLSKGGARLTHFAQGTPTLTLLCVDRIGPHQVEPWALFWHGQAAADFYAQHRDKLLPGTPLTVCVERMRSHTTGRTVEISAHVTQLDFAPAAQAKAVPA